MSPVPAPLLIVAPLVIAALVGPAAAAPEPDLGDPSTVVSGGDRFAMRLDTTGTGWASIDIRAAQATDLHLHLAHDTIQNLCTFTFDGVGIYDDGHYTAIHLWKPDAGSPFDGRFFTWLGSPHVPLPILQTGICGDLDPLHLEAGETARLVVASSLPGYHIELLGAQAEDARVKRTLPLAAHPDLQLTEPEPEALVAEAGSRGILALDKQWRSSFDVGPAALYGLPWLHAEAEEPLPVGTFQDVGFREWGFEGADFTGTAPAGPVVRGTNTPMYDWVVVFPGWTRGGQVDGFVHEEALAGAHVSDYETGAEFLSIPLAPADR